MPVKIEYKASVERDLRKLGPGTALRIVNKIERALTTGGHTGAPLSGEFAGMYRVRVGDYRVLYVRTEEGYLVLRVGHRREIYRSGRPPI